MSVKESLRHHFQYHPLDNDKDRESVNKVYDVSWALVEAIIENIPESSHRDVAIQKVKTAVLHAVEGLRECKSKV